jgi:hypothetical protein
LGFIPSGITKIIGERFASGLSVNHPMGQYLEALHHTGYYYTMIGIAQVVAAILLLIPRTVLLGTLLYLPIIVNICILSFAVRFEGSIVSSPLMVLANLYLLCWNYDKLKYILPIAESSYHSPIPDPIKYSNKFPFKFFGTAFLTAIIVIFGIIYSYDIVPRNSFSDCQKQFNDAHLSTAEVEFCECIHKKGNPLNECIEAYENTKIK